MFLFKERKETIRKRLIIIIEIIIVFSYNYLELHVY